MTDCPSDMELGLLAEGKLSAERMRDVLDHVRVCTECAHVVSLLAEVDAVADFVDAPTMAEQIDARRALDRLMGPECASHSANHEPTKQASVFERLSDTVSGFIPGMGLGYLAVPSAMPALGTVSEAHNDYGAGERMNRHATIDEVFNSAGIPDVGMDGAPGLLSSDVQQGYTNTCAIRCQELILRDSGVELSEEDLMRMAAGHGWYDPEFGTFAADVGMLLEAQGIDTNTYERATIFHLTNELAQGHRVIVAVDSGELWQRNSAYMELMERLEDITTGDRPDHAVLVSGVDISDPDDPMVVITDPGTGEVAAEYPLDQFLNAWEDSGFHMVATADSPPQFALDHVHTIGELPYDRFAAWYPSVESLTGGEPLFDELCDQFDQILTTTGILPDAVAGMDGTFDVVNGAEGADVDFDDIIDIDDDLDDGIDWV
ncbi:MAG: hypothetical protein EOL87_07550 [Spartobacteria bacterium]|nr:hypothetical protein [Spartobacteria bacterium]